MRHWSQNSGAFIPETFINCQLKARDWSRERRESGRSKKMWPGSPVVCESAWGQDSGLPGLA